MNHDELRGRVERFVVEECKGRWPAVSLIESLCREMIAEGLERVNYEMNYGKHNRFQSEWAEWCLEEAQRVKDNHDTKKS